MCRAVVREQVEPSLFVYCPYNDDTLEIMDQINVQEMKVHQLRSLVSRKCGLPVSVFRLTTAEGTEMYDCQVIDCYGVKVGDKIVLEVWDGWSEMLNAAVIGFTTDLMDSLFKDDVIARFQMKVALYLAAHFGHVELAVNLLRHGVRPDEAIGEHPLRQWCKGEESHIDTLKAAIHESAETGQLNVLRSFVHHSVTSVLAKDGNGLTALNISLRMKQRHCASFLLTKQWSKIQYTKKASLPLSIYTKMKKWCEQAKTKTLIIHGHYKSSIKNYKRHLAQGALVGHGLQLDGYGKSKLSTKPLNLLKIEEEEFEKRKKRLYGIEPLPGQMDPEIYFKSLGSVALFRPMPKLGKWGKLVSKANNFKKGASEDANHVRIILLLYFFLLLIFCLKPSSGFILSFIIYKKFYKKYFPYYMYLYNFFIRYTVFIHIYIYIKKQISIYCTVKYTEFFYIIFVPQNG